MRHAREDYNRIQDPAGRIPEDEPVFLLRGQDEAAPAAVRVWADVHEAQSPDSPLVRLAREHARRMQQWQQVEGAKVADGPHDDSALPDGVDAVTRILRDRCERYAAELRKRANRIAVLERNLEAERRAEESRSVQVAELEQELRDLRAAVKEWVCMECDKMYPGPPAEGVRCVICPDCGGTTLPRALAERTAALEKVELVSAYVDRMRRVLDGDDPA